MHQAGAPAIKACTGNVVSTVRNSSPSTPTGTMAPTGETLSLWMEAYGTENESEGQLAARWLEARQSHLLWPDRYERDDRSWN